MKINKDKTELITLSKERDDVEITIEGVRVRLVKNFKYLGVNINEKCDMGIEITKSIESYTNNLRLLNPLLKKKKIPTKVKVIIYKTIPRPVFTYSSDSWTLTAKQKRKIQAAEMCFTSN